MKRDQPSATAMLVAASVARHGVAHGLPAVAVDLAERALALGASHGSPVGLLARNRLGRVLLTALERVALPGLGSHHCARKAWLWERLQRKPAVERQILWLGVGFDGLGRALASGAHDVHVIETDHPATLRLRRALVRDDAIKMAALELPAQLDALAAHCAERPTTVVCEGVLMYLHARTVMRALRALAALPEPPHLIFSVLDTLRPAGRGFRRPSNLVRQWLQFQGEPFRWRASPERVRSCLSAAGYVVAHQWHGNGFGEYAIEASAPLQR